MPLYKVLVRPAPIEIVVVAEDASHAADIAESLDPGLFAPEAGELVAGNTRGSVYRCSKCQGQALKKHWGPGWLTCPICFAFGTSQIVNS